MLVPVILCGGSGTRLWPLSRNLYPKQLLPLVTEHTMLQDTVLRVKKVSHASNVLVICNDAHRFLVAEQLLEIQSNQATIILEPIGKNTAPAVTIAALHLLSQINDALMLILPADHVIQDENAFQAVVQEAIKLANQNYLVTFGITPKRPETGYGYIKKAEMLPDSEGYAVEQFVEKPDFETALQYFSSKQYLWNSGMFLFKASLFLEEMQKFSEDILMSCKLAYENKLSDLDFLRLEKNIFSNCRSDSIDYAVMEKSDRVAVVSLDAGWCDVGSWDALSEIKQADKNGNVIQGDVYTDHVKNSYIHAENRLLAVVGVEDHVIVETADAVLVAHKKYCQDVKSIVSQLKSDHRAEIDLHRRVYRPWGYYEVLDGANEFQVKRIMVKPGARLSLQAHHYRSEHWVVISGIATVTSGEKMFELYVNESTYIPIQVKHRLENKTNVPLIMIEVQCGDKISEEDIVRFEDAYGRQ